MAQKPAVARPAVQKTVVQEPEAVKPKPQRRVLKRGSQSIGTPSIKRAMRGEFEDTTQLSAKEQHELYSKEGEVEQFSSDQLKEKWDLFLTRLEDGSNMKVTLANVPKIEEDFSLLLEIDNRIQDELIANIRPELVSFLRKELRNSKINLKTLITEVVREKVIYSDIERYQALAGKNPNLAYLKQTLNLDF